MALIKFRKLFIDEWEALVDKDKNTRYTVFDTDDKIIGEYIGNEPVIDEELDDKVQEHEVAISSLEGDLRDLDEKVDTNVAVLDSKVTGVAADLVSAETRLENNKADKATEVNGKALTGDIELTSEDIIDTYTTKPISQAIEDLSFGLYDFFIRLTGYVLATDDDFIVKDASNSYFEYIGTDEYIIVPKTVQGYQVTNLRSGSTASMFSNVSNVKGVITANKLSNFAYAFYGCKSTSLDLRYLNTSNVTSMNYMFGYCRSLTSLDLSSFNTSKVTDMNYMFFRCSNLTSLDLSNFDTSNVTGMTNMFNDSRATTLDLSSFDTSNVTSMQGMFSGSRATTLDLSNFTHESITKKVNMFWGVKNCTVYFKNQDEIDFFTADTDWHASNTAVIKGA